MDDVDWLVSRLGDDCSPVLEPACGSGRYLAALGQRNIEAVGIDSSPAAVELARRRLHEDGLAGTALLADMADFALPTTFGGAICPINSLAYLHGAEALTRHRRCVAAHLRPKSRYLVQLELRDETDPWRGVRASEWESEADGVRVRTTWRVESIDVESRVEVHHATIECLSGPEAGYVLDEVHRLASRTPESFAAAVSESPFTYSAVFDGDRDGRPAVPVGASGRLLWHELVLD